MAAVRPRNNHGAMPDLVILVGVVVAFVATLSAVLWGIAAGTGGDGEEQIEHPR